MKKGRRGINPASKPSGDGCSNAWRHRKVGGFISVGVPNVGTSVAATVLRASMRPSMRRQQGIRSLPASSRVRIGSYDYEKQGMIKGVELLPPHSHPEDQPAPGPAGRVPANWESLLH